MSYLSRKFRGFRTAADKRRARTIDFLLGGVFHALADKSVDTARHMFEQVARYAAERPEKRESLGKRMRRLRRMAERIMAGRTW